MLAVAIAVFRPARLSGAPKRLSAGRIENTVETRAEPRYATTPAPSRSLRTQAIRRWGRAVSHAVSLDAPMRADSRMAPMARMRTAPVARGAILAPAVIRNTLA